MSALPLSLMIEAAVAVLLALTIGYCVVLNKRLKRLQADRAVLAEMIADLVRATDMANGAIAGLKEAAVEADEKLNQRLNDAERFAIELANHVQSGQAVMERIARITAAAGPRPAGPGPAASEPRKARAALDVLESHQRRRENAA